MVYHLRVFLIGQNKRARGTHGRESNVLIGHVGETIAKHLFNEVQVLTL